MNVVRNKKVIAELKRLARENDGLLQPELVVEAARPKDSPLHSRFTWDDSIAAHQYRLEQARRLIRVTVEVIQGCDEPVDVFVSLTTDRERDAGGYRVLTTVLSDVELREQLLADALDELRVFQEKYKRLKELAAVFAAIKKLKKRKK